MKSVFCNAFVRRSLLVLTTLGVSAAYAQTSSQYQEEDGLELAKISGKKEGIVIGHHITATNSNTDYETLICGHSAQAGVAWGCAKNLAISPDGTKLAYMAIDKDGNHNIFITDSHINGQEVQRTKRNLTDGICWSADGRIYFGDYDDPNVLIKSINAEEGAAVMQQTKGDVTDYDPSITKDGKYVYFTRWTEENGPHIYRQEKATGMARDCGKGFATAIDPNNNDIFYCIRNTANGRSEVCLIDLSKGTESIILSELSRSFTHPTVSPDGKWLLMVGNSTAKNKKDNLDIFAVHTDGSGLIQLTHHHGDDVCPVWAPDGRSIFFLSSRYDAEGNFNIWRMNFMETPAGNQLAQNDDAILVTVHTSKAAQIALDGDKSSTNYLTKSVPAGMHNVTVYYGNDFKKEYTLDVNANGETRFEYPIEGRFSANIIPSNAKVYLDDELWSSELQNIPMIGEHTLGVVGDKELYLPTSRAFQVSPLQDMTLDVEAQKRRPKLNGFAIVSYLPSSNALGYMAGLGRRFGGYIKVGLGMDDAFDGKRLGSQLGFGQECDTEKKTQYVYFGGGITYRPHKYVTTYLGAGMCSYSYCKVVGRYYTVYDHHVYDEDFNHYLYGSDHIAADLGIIYRWKALLFQVGYTFSVAQLDPEGFDGRKSQYNSQFVGDFSIGIGINIHKEKKRK